MLPGFIYNGAIIVSAAFSETTCINAGQTTGGGGGGGGGGAPAGKETSQTAVWRHGPPTTAII